MARDLARGVLGRTTFKGARQQPQDSAQVPSDPRKRSLPKQGPELQPMKHQLPVARPHSNFGGPQSPSVHSSSNPPNLEANSMRDFTCCGSDFPSLQDLLQHYEEAHASASPNTSRGDSFSQSSPTGIQESDKTRHIRTNPFSPGPTTAHAPSTRSGWTSINGRLPPMVASESNHGVNYDSTYPASQAQDPRTSLVEVPYVRSLLPKDGLHTPVSLDRPFQCRQCSQAFARGHDLKRHSRIHSETKPFSCDGCRRKFSRKDALKV